MALIKSIIEVSEFIDSSGKTAWQVFVNGRLGAVSYKSARDAVKKSLHKVDDSGKGTI